ncbi:hypothetical protein RND81_09G149100 [Saponaria officinalis]|uniref:J domain-containing protein n=1 Tax=Saponaria officinalis TaxID=3572 RepID=A0AAW1IKU7_SAPOF
MDLPIDHYKIVGLPSGEENFKLTINDINKAYKRKALVLHPDKNPHNPNAHANFTQLKSSYEILKLESSRALFDDLLRVRREKALRHREFDAKRRRMASDLEDRERSCSAAADAESKANEQSILRQLDEEITKFRAKKRKSYQTVSPSVDFADPLVFPRQSQNSTPCVPAHEHHAFETSVFEKLKKAVQKQK